MADVLLVGDTAGWVRAYDKRTGTPLERWGYPLRLSEEPYKEGTQGEQWWEPIGGTATQMTVAAGLLLAGVNSESEERTVLRAFGMQPAPAVRPDLTLRYLDVPATATGRGFTARVRAACVDCLEPLTVSLSLWVNGAELPRQTVTFRQANGFAADLSWTTGPMPEGATVAVVATIDPDNQVPERDETNNTLRAQVPILTRPDLPPDWPPGQPPGNPPGQPGGPGPGDRWGSKLIN